MDFQPQPRPSEAKGTKKQAAKTGVLNAFQDHQLALRRFISRLVRRSSDIDDIAQETFLRAYNAEKNKLIWPSPVYISAYPGFPHSLSAWQ
jgi:DNA-directed RNA polymerase specialized sigma24 family protein